MPFDIGDDLFDSLISKGIDRGAVRSGFLQNMRPKSEKLALYEKLASKEFFLVKQGENAFEGTHHFDTVWAVH